MDETFDCQSRREVREQLKLVGDGITELLYYKNCKYKNSIFSPLEIFSEADPESIVTNHINEKLARIKQNHGDALRKNDVADLMGYLRFLCVIRGWTDFKDLMD
jgi:hypothetical protein